MAANKEPNEGNSQANKKSGVAGYVKNLERGIMLFDNRVLRFGIEDSELLIFNVFDVFIAVVG